MLEVCVEEQNTRKGNERVRLIVWQGESQVLWSMLAERKKCRFSFWSELVLLPVLWHPRYSAAGWVPADCDILLAPHPTCKTHTHTYIDWQPDVSLWKTSSFNQQTRWSWNHNYLIAVLQLWNQLCANCSVFYISEFPNWSLSVLCVWITQ